MNNEAGSDGTVEPVPSDPASGQTAGAGKKQIRKRQLKSSNDLPVAQNTLREERAMPVGTGGTFAKDAKNIGMNSSDIRDLTENIPNRLADRGVFPYTFRSKKYGVRYEVRGVDVTLTGISAL